MLVKDVIDENFQDYRKPSMFIATAICDWKCCIDAGTDASMCQNSKIAKQKEVEVSADEIFRRYSANNITKAILFGGLEPILQIDDLLEIITYIRNENCMDDIVIYTGYNENEIPSIISKLKRFKNIIVKFGRFIPDAAKTFDKVLGVWLNSSNQYAKKIS